MSVFTGLWVGWLVMFLVVEGVALFNRRPGDTLSEHVWAVIKPWKGPRERSGAEQLLRFLLLALLVWLPIHFFTGGWV